LGDSSSPATSPETEMPISLIDHILEEVKGRDSPMKKPSKKFSPTKQKYVANKVGKIGDSSDDEGGGFQLQKMD
jgi:hypothetical protein